MVRAGVAVFLSAVRKERVADTLKSNWDGDRTIAPLISKGGVAPTDSANAAELTTDNVVSAVIGLSPPTAALSLIPLCLRVSLENRAGITIPARITDATAASTFLADGAAIPVRSLNVLAGPTLKPSKLPVIVPFTNELAERSAQDLETIFKQALGEEANLALDKEMFSATAGSSIRPAGLLNGVAAIAASANATDLATACAEDVCKLVNALATNGGGTRPVFICSPGGAASLKMFAGPKFDFPVLASAAVGAGTVICVEATSFVSGFSGLPEFSQSKQTVLHMDTAPAQIGTTGALAGGETRSLWQTDCSAIEMILRCSWAMRAAGHVAWLTGAVW